MVVVGGGGFLPSLNSQPAQGEGKGERGEEGVKCTAKIIIGKPWRKDCGIHVIFFLLFVIPQMQCMCHFIKIVTTNVS